MMHPGAKIRHKKYGEGIIKEKKRTSITADFPGEGEKDFGIKFAFTSGVVELLDVDDSAQHIEEIRNLLKNGDNIRAMYQACSNEIEPYREELE